MPLYLPPTTAGAKGTSIINFGAFPGDTFISLDVIGQGAIAADSVVNAWSGLTATADHSLDEHLVETIKFLAGNIVAGIGFTIYAFNIGQLHEPIVPLIKRDNERGGLVNTQGIQIQKGGGLSTKLYGQWTVAWKWE